VGVFWSSHGYVLQEAQNAGIIDDFVNQLPKGTNLTLFFHMCAAGYDALKSDLPYEMIVRSLDDEGKDQPDSRAGGCFSVDPFLKYYPRTYRPYSFEPLRFRHRGARMPNCDQPPRGTLQRHITGRTDPGRRVANVESDPDLKGFERFMDNYRTCLDRYFANVHRYMSDGWNQKNFVALYFGIIFWVLGIIVWMTGSCVSCCYKDCKNS